MVNKHPKWTIPGVVYPEDSTSKQKPPYDSSKYMTTKELASILPVPTKCKPSVITKTYALTVHQVGGCYLWDRKEVEKAKKHEEETARAAKEKKTNYVSIEDFIAEAGISKSTMANYAKKGMFHPVRKKVFCKADRSVAMRACLGAEEASWLLCTILTVKEAASAAKKLAKQRIQEMREKAPADLDTLDALIHHIETAVIDRY